MISRKSTQLATKVRNKALTENSSPSKDDPAVQIYSRRLNEKKCSEIVAQSTKEHIQKEELKKCTFHPEINRVNISLSKSAIYSKTLAVGDKTFENYLGTMRKGSHQSPTKKLTLMSHKNSNDQKSSGKKSDKSKAIKLSCMF